MKKLILFLFISFNFTVFSQTNTQYKAIFQYKKIVDEAEKAKRDSLIKVNPEMADMMKKFQKMFDNRTFEIYFDKNTSLYKEKRTLNKPGKGRTSINLGKSRILHKNILKKIYTEQKPFFDDNYIISDSIPNYKWKITKESKMIGSYLVLKAEGVEKKKDRKTKTEKEVTVIAWFTPQIPIGNGPGKYAGLPGFIMEIDRKDNVLLCTKIIVNPKDAKELKKPTDGKKVSAKEYDKIQQEKLKKMRKMYESRRSDKNSGNRVIIIR